MYCELTGPVLETISVLLCRMVISPVTGMLIIALLQSIRPKDSIKSRIFSWILTGLATMVNLLKIR